ncbi:hypothetical protein [Sporohalobacter salinus]|uniref:YkvI family membrane protein n=1 Tax=Sporohalobacter salinus TaxID=1494606 RepID=UPI00195F5FE3|nr:hypothetical protein [Sporohalobacter salinus]MBM7624320.1 putative membrane protein YkvI [Sporohalobacter salinus]
MRRDHKLIIQSAVTYIGAIIGAGFASGQEILQFFSLQQWGYLGIIFCGILFAFLAYMIFSISLDFNLATYDQLFHWFGSEKLGSLGDLVILFFLFCSFIIMLSGSGEVFVHYFQLNKNIGILLTAIIIVLTIKSGIEGVMKLNIILVPGLILLIIVIFGLSIENNFSLAVDKQQINSLTTENWIFQAINYVVYNFFLALPVLTAIPTKIRKKKLLKRSSLLAGIILTVLGLIINTLLVQNFNLIKGSQIPMLEILSYKSNKLYFLYSIILWLAMITTATSSFYGLIKRLNNKLTMSLNKLLIIFTIAGFLLAKFHFAVLVSTIYPFLGNIGGIIFLGFLTSYIRRKVVI